MNMKKKEFTIKMINGDIHHIQIENEMNISELVNKIDTVNVINFAGFDCFDRMNSITYYIALNIKYIISIE